MKLPHVSTSDLRKFYLEQKQEASGSDFIGSDGNWIKTTPHKPTGYNVVGIGENHITAILR